MKKVLVLFTCFFISNCLGYYSTSPHFTFFTFGAGHHIRSRTGAKTLGSARLEKKGEDCTANYMVVNTLYHPQRPTIKKAMKNGKISKIAVVDHRSSSVMLGAVQYTLYSKDCIIVWGE